MDAFYPTLPEAVVLQIQVAIRQMKENPAGYLDGSHYSEDVKDFLREVVGGAAPSVTRVFDGEVDKLDYIESEIVAVMTDLASLVASLGQGDASEKLQVAKARAGLIEKLVSAREKIWNMREMSVFQGRLMGFLEDICSADQIADLKIRLRDLKSVNIGDTV